MNTNKNSSRNSARYAMVIATGLAAFCILGSAPQTHAAISTFDDGIVVGGTSMSSGLLLDVNGNIGANQFCNASGGGCVSVGSIGSVWATSGNDIYNTNSANVGIGTSNPQRKLHVTGNIRADGRHLYLGSSQDIYGDNSSAIYYDSNHSSVAQIILRDASNNTLGRIYGSGGDSIGLLDDQGQWAIQHNRDDWTRWQINNTEYMRLTPSGLTVNQLSVDTNSVNSVSDIALSANAAIGAPNSLNYVVGTSGVHLWWVDAPDASSGRGGATEVMRIANNGNVGIGTNNPATTLDVNGHIRTPNQLRANNICDTNGNNCSPPVSVSYDNQNVGFDSYGSWTAWNGTSNGDTCDGNNGEYSGDYTCPVNESKTCQDEESYCYSRDKSQCNGYYYRHRDITCKRERVMVNVQ